MTQHEKLYTGVSRAAWGYFFLYVDLKFGTVSILPGFVGMLLFLSAIELLKEERRDLAILRPFAVILTVWYVVDWMLSWGGISLEEQVAVPGLLIGVVYMYFQFQIMTDFAALAEKYGTAEDTDSETILRLRTIQILLLTFMTAMEYMKDWLPDWWEPCAVIVMILMVIIGFCLMMEMFSLRKIFILKEI